MCHCDVSFLHRHRVTHYILSRRVSGRPVVLKHNDVLSLKTEDVCSKYTATAHSQSLE